MSPPRKDRIKNQDKNTSYIEKYQSIPPYILQFPPGFKSLRKEANDDNPESTYTSGTDRDDKSSTDQDDSIENVKAMNNKKDDEEYKEENSQHQHNNETVIKKTKKNNN